MSHMLAVYHRYLEAAGFRPDTVERAVRIARQYSQFCFAHEHPFLSRQSVEAFLAGAAKRQVSGHTLLNYWKDLKMAFDWALSEGLVASNPVIQIRKPKPSLYERERDVVYSEEEMARLMATCPTWTWMGVRDAAIITVLWETGIRAQELCDLLVTDVDFDEGELTVRDGKAGVR